MKNAALYTINLCAILTLICGYSLLANSSSITTNYLNNTYVYSPPEDSATISGTVLNWCDEPVVGFPVLINTHTVYTDINGLYSLEVPTGTGYTITYGPTNDYANGVDSTDLYALPELILFGFPSPYAAIAADMNLDQLISTFDIVILSQFIEEIASSFPGPSWVLIPADYVFPNPNDPWMEIYPEVININNLTSDFTTDFTAIKRGDLNCSADPVLVDPGFGVVQGVVFDELSGILVCEYNEQDAGLAGWIVEATSEDETFYTTTNQDGSYYLELPAGTYEIKTIIPNNMRVACLITLPVSIGTGQTVNLNLGHYQTTLCPFMELDLAPVTLAPCSSDIYHVSYCNKGTVTAEGVYVELQFEDEFTVLNSEASFVNLGNGLYRFDLPDQPAGHCNTFALQVASSCDVVEGNTYCVDANIYPNELCNPINQSWDGSHLELSVECLGGQVQFTIKNTGAPMLTQRQYIVIEDDLVMMNEQIQLDTDEEHTFFRAADGTTKRLEMETQAGPYQSNAPNITIEACGVNSIGEQSSGYVTAFNNDSGYPFERRVCTEVNATNEGNYKVASPKGLGQDAFLQPNTSLTYQIYFQNTTDNLVTNLLIKDQLMDGLSPASVSPGASSHPYQFSISDNGTLVFSFENILLPPSSGKGFVSFSIDQEIDNPDGVMLENSATIQFDDQPEIQTNFAAHLIDSDFLINPSANIFGSINSLYDSYIPANVYLISEGDTLNQDYTFYYNFEADLGSDYSLASARADYNLNGVSTFDMVIISQHLIGAQLLDSPYKLIAADVNYSESITDEDLELISLLITGETEWPGPDWRMVPASYDFPDPTDPWTPFFPESWDIHSLSGDTEVNFLAVKLGDVNFDALVNEPIQASSRDLLPLRKQLILGKDEVAFYPMEARKLLAYQLELWMPEGALFEGIELAKNAEIFNYYLDGNTLRIVWHHSEPILFDENTPLFLLKGSGLEDVMLSHEVTDMGVGEGLELYNLKIKYTHESEMPVYVFPNPANGILNVQGQAHQDIVVVELFNQLGQIVFQNELDAKGNWSEQLNMEGLQSGVYQLRVQQGEHQYVEKVHVWH